MCIADEAAVAVLGTIERERRIAVVMKRTECLVVAHLEPEGCGDLLNGKLIELHNINFV